MFKVDFLLIRRVLDFRINNRSLIRVIINYFKNLNIIIKRE